jgi:hypothetical protein
MQVCGGAAAEQGGLSAGPDGGEVAGLDARRPVPDPVDAPMDRDQGALLHPARHRMPRDSSSEKLGTGYDSVAAGSDFGDDHVHRAGFASHMRQKSARHAD